MNFSKISKVLVLFTFLSVFSYGVISAEEKNLVTTKTDESPVVEEKKENVDSNDTSASGVMKSNKGTCADLGYFTINSTVSKKSSHFGLFKREDGSLYVKDITDDNKNDANKTAEFQSKSVSYAYVGCCYPRSGSECTDVEESKLESDEAKHDASQESIATEQ